MIAEARALSKRALAAMTDEEDAEITAAAESDPDSRPFTDEEFARAKRRGRPPVARPKEHLNLRLDAEVVARLKAGGAGWQTRANAILRQALGIDG